MSEVCECTRCQSAISPLFYLLDLLDFSIINLKQIKIDLAARKNGLIAQYFEGIDLQKAKATLVDSTVNFDWGMGAPNPAVPADKFSVRWTGYILPEFSEEYIFSTVSDDGVALWVGNSLIIDNWKDHTATEDKGTIYLEAGRWYPIQLEYYDNAGNAVIKLSWESARQTKQIIPTERLLNVDLSKVTTQAIDLEFLAKNFHQPLGDLYASCESVDKQVRQVRICVEVLRGYYASILASRTSAQKAILDNAERAYRFATYSSILLKLGTSFDELRATLASDDAKKAALANRLGIDQGPKASQLAALLFDPKKLTEDDLEQTFGFPSTQGNPLRAIADSKIKTWRQSFLGNFWRTQDWPPEPYLDAQLPVVEPNILAPEVVIEGTPVPGDIRLGKSGPAYALWQARDQWVKDTVSALDKERKDKGLLAAMELALGKPLPTDLDKLYQNWILNQDLEKTRKRIVELGFTPESFVALMTYKGRVDAGDSLDPADWDQVYAILTQVIKIKKQYATWVSEEKAKGITLGPKLFLIALKEPPLLPWLAEPTMRRMWQQTLRLRSQPALIDPDLIPRTHLKELKGDAFDLWNQRAEWIGKRIKALSDAVAMAATPLAGLDAIILAATGATAKSLDELSADHAAGKRIAPRLEQLTLPLEALQHLVRLRQLLVNGLPLMEEDWDSIYSILVQVEKRRELAEWRDQEKGKAISLTFEFFRIPPPPAPSIPPVSAPQIVLNRWRANWQALRDWQNRLEVRINAQSGMNADLADIISITEESVLPQLRDALALACASPGANLDSAAKWVTNNLLINASTNGNQLTTRIAQAIETLQGLLFGVRNGLLLQTQPDLVLTIDNKDFDQEWRWLGSYATWRAAMLVLLYPENLLLPSLRQRQTEAFRTLVNELRQTRQLTPKQAMVAADRYYQYLRDLARLRIEASCDFTIEIDGKDRSLYLIFGRGVETNTVYWSSYDAKRKGPPNDSQSLWKGLTVLGPVTKIIGAVPFCTDYAGLPKSVVLFTKRQTSSKTVLSMIKYDIENGQWENDVKDLDLPNDVTYWSATVLLQRTQSSLPYVFVMQRFGGIYGRSLNPVLDDWADGEWDTYLADEEYDPYYATAELKGALPISSSAYRIFVDEISTSRGMPRIIHKTYLTSSQVIYRLYDRKNNIHLYSVGQSQIENLRRQEEMVYGGIIGYVSSGESYSSEKTNLHQLAGSGTKLFLFSDKKQSRDDIDSWAKIGWSYQGVIANVRSASSKKKIPGLAPIYRLDAFFIGTLYTTNLEEKAEAEKKGWFTRTIVGYCSPPANYKLNEFTQFTWQSDPTGLTLERPVRWRGAATVSSNSFLVYYDEFVALHNYGNADYALAPVIIGNIEYKPRGANVRVRHIDPEAPSAKLAVSVSGKDITISLSTDAFGQIDTKESAIIAEIRADPAAAALISPTTAPGPGDHIAQTGPIVWKIQSGNVRNVVPHSGPNKNLELVNEIVDPTRTGSEESKGWYLSPVGETTGIFSKDSPFVVPLLNEDDFANLVTSELDLSLPQFKNLEDTKRPYLKNTPGSVNAIVYIEEAYYSVPILIGTQLQQRGQYEAALQWFRLVYDYVAHKKVYYGLVREERGSHQVVRSKDWLKDAEPLNPHTIATGRADAYTRYTLLALAQCFIEYADAEFTRDTVESVPKARVLYIAALDTLAQLSQGLSACQNVLNTFHALLSAEPELLPFADEMVSRVQHLGLLTRMSHAVSKSAEHLKGNGTAWQRFERVQAELAAEEAALPLPLTLSQMRLQQTAWMLAAEKELLEEPTIADSLRELQVAHAAVFEREGRTSQSVNAHTKAPVANAPDHVMPSWLHRRILGTEPADSANLLMTSEGPASGWPSFGAARPTACVPTNPVIDSLHRYAQVNVYKIDTNRNIAGIVRQLAPYAAPTDVQSGLPTIDANGRVVLPDASGLAPTPYRFATLIERAKQLVGQAGLVESQLLAALEKRDLEHYNLLKAKQDVQLAKAGVVLQDLRIKEANLEVDLAELQQERAQIQVDYYAQLLAEGISGLEAASLALLQSAAAFQLSAATTSFLAAALPSAITFGFPPSMSFSPQGSASAVAGGMSYLAGSMSTTASVLSTLASYERRAKEWSFQRSVALQDVRIGEQQVKIAKQRVEITKQERAIAQLQVDHASEVVDFLTNKFTNYDLYDWMSGVLEQAYSSLLQQGTAIAKLAAVQLAFERQEPVPAFIQGEYWNAPNLDAPTKGLLTQQASDGQEQQTNRHGLTGSERLLQDIYKLDEYAFDTDKRKLQLTKNISLSRLDPYNFQRFREIGVISFRTPMELFDRDFPGHYLRLIKRIRLSVIALIPAVQGIHATLTTDRVSRVVTKQLAGFAETIISYGPDYVALSSPRDATGLFELDAKSDMLNPFEGIGVDTTWHLKMHPGANLFEYQTISDVVLTIEYTALNSFDHYIEVVNVINQEQLTAERPYSFRHQFSDAWYALNNPEQSAQPMKVRFLTRPADFPPNIANLRIQHITLFFSGANNTTGEVEVANFLFTPLGTGERYGSSARSLDGSISTRKSSGLGWTSMLGQPPFGEWELQLPDLPAVRARFAKGEISDVLFVITYAGDTPSWPVG